MDTGVRKFAVLVLVAALMLCVVPAIPGQPPVAAASSMSNGRIAFTSDRDGNNEVYVMNPDGTGATNLTNNSASDADPAWSPDGSKIAFVSYRDGGWNIYVMNADGSGQTNLANNVPYNKRPSWSPDGSRIVLTSYKDGNGEIYVVNADGSGQTNLTNNWGGDRNPVWSPDGSKIAFESNRDIYWNIYVMNADGSGQTNLTNNAAYDGEPVWSPDGSKIAFVSCPYKGNNYCQYGVYVMNADGSGQTVLAENGVRWDASPSWSPDGSKIAFVTFWGGDNNEIYVMNADGSGQTNLTNNAAYDGEPVWSPDGSKIAFVSNRNGNDEVYVINANGSGVTNLTNNLAYDTQPDWGPGAEVVPTATVTLTSTSSPTPSQTPTQIPLSTPTPSADDVRLDVPLIRQNEGDWASDIYNLYPLDKVSETIARWGCATTSAAMVLGYYGVNTTPKELDDWLAANGGYVPKEHLIIWSRVRAFAAERGLVLKEPIRMVASRANIDSALSARVPPIVSVCWQNCGTDEAKWHWVVVTGKSGDDYLINDPSSWRVLNRQKLNDYPVWGNMVRFERGGSNTTSPSLVLYLCSPAELLVTDALGRRTGIDPTTSGEFSEIPGAFYGDEFLSPADDSGSPTMHTKTLVLPEAGTYTVEVVGTGNGSYTLLAISSGSNGQPLSETITRSVTPGQVDSYVLDYSPDSGIVELVQQTYLPLVMR